MTLTSLPRTDAATPDLLKSSTAPHSRVSIDAATGAGAKARAAFGDVAETLQLWRLVWKLSFLDIRLRYRGSMLGPFWLTLSTGVMIGALGFLYAGLFHTDIHTYLPYLSLSLILWNFLSALTAEGCTCFTVSESMIRASRMPLTLHAARVVIRNFLVFAHNIVVVVVVFAVMRKMPGAQSYMIVPAFVLWFIDGFAICLLIGAFCARFRDVPPIVGSIMQIAFFVTPILWSPAVLQHRHLADQMEPVLFAAGNHPRATARNTTASRHLGIRLGLFRRSGRVFRRDVCPGPAASGLLGIARCPASPSPTCRSCSRSITARRGP
jgi:lipopolysaccharide transport system permease protein